MKLQPSSEEDDQYESSGQQEGDDNNIDEEQEDQEEYNQEDNCDDEEEKQQQQMVEAQQHQIHNEGGMIADLNTQEEEEGEESQSINTKTSGIRKLKKNNNLIKVKQSPAASPPKLTKLNLNTKMDDVENHIKCEIKDIQEFKYCLDSVKFPIGPKKFNSGILLKSHSQQGSIMTKCLLKKEFFGENFYKIDIRRAEDQAKDFNIKENLMSPLIEFCLPFHELKQIVDGMVEEGNVLQLEYPVDDNYLEIKIPEEFKNSSDKVTQMTTLQLETYEAQHNLSSEKQLRQDDVCAQVFGKILHFKRALKEFSFLGEKEPIELRFSEQYPHISMRYGNDQYGRNHVIKFNQKIDDMILKQLSDSSAYYTIESLRLGLSRISNDNLVCIVTMYNQGFLSVKHMNDQMVLMIESIILPMDAMEDDE